MQKCLFLHYQYAEREANLKLLIKFSHAAIHKGLSCFVRSIQFGCSDLKLFLCEFALSLWLDTYKLSVSLCNTTIALWQSLQHNKESCHISLVYQSVYSDYIVYHIWSKLFYLLIGYILFCSGILPILFLLSEKFANLVLLLFGVFFGEFLFGQLYFFVQFLVLFQKFTKSWVVQRFLFQGYFCKYLSFYFYSKCLGNNGHIFRIVCRYKGKYWSVFYLLV